MVVCQYAGRFPYGNSDCNECDLLFETCSPVCSDNGAVFSAECAMEFFCPGCLLECPNKELINL